MHETIPLPRMSDEVRLTVRGRWRIAFQANIEIPIPEARFAAPTAFGPCDIALHADATLDAILPATVQRETFDRLITATTEPSKETLAKHGPEIIRLYGELSRGVRCLLRNLKLDFGWDHIAPNLLTVEGVVEWSTDGNTWEMLPAPIEAYHLHVPAVPLTDEAIGLLQKRVAADFEPLYGKLILSRARWEPDARQKWIDATTAAELAVKELLIRQAPQLETLILELPSPRTDVLYGKVLESIVGEASPHAGELQKGAATRNKLVHRPRYPAPSNTEAAQYVDMVGEAIGHLEKFLHAEAATPV